MLGSPQRTTTKGAQVAKTLLNHKILSGMILDELKSFEFGDRPQGINLLEVHGVDRLTSNWEIEGFIESHEGTWTPCYRQAVEIQARLRKLYDVDW
jgi:hypothetical protein